MTDEAEEWRPVVGLEEVYEVSSRGHVRSLDRAITDECRGSVRTRRFPGVILRWQINNKGYAYVSLYGKGDYRRDRICRHLVQSLVAAAFIGPRPAGMDIAHNDGNPLNNAFENLRYASRKENMADTEAHGTRMRGEAVPSAKLTAASVGEIKSLLGRFSQSEIAAKFGVSQRTISAINVGRTWKHVP